MKEAVFCFCLAVRKRGAEKFICPDSHKWEGKNLDSGVDVPFHYRICKSLIVGILGMVCHV